MTSSYSSAIASWPQHFPSAEHVTYAPPEPAGVCSCSLRRGRLVDIVWIYSNDADFASFALWVRDELQNGAAWFAMTLSLSDGEGLRHARFSSPYSAIKNSEGQWQVSARLEIIDPDREHMMVWQMVSSFLAQTQDRVTPVGSIISYAAQTPPKGWLECDGAAISRSDYANLFKVIGTTYGDGDGETTFNLPDLRSEFVRGWDHGRGVDDHPEHRQLGSHQRGSMVPLDDGNETLTLGHGGYHKDGSIFPYTPARKLAREVYGYDCAKELAPRPENRNYLIAGRRSRHPPDDYYTEENLWGVTRPRNVALMFCIKD
ncbi:MAG: phage tail protein [Pseudomonadota bacterium]